MSLEFEKPATHGHTKTAVCSSNSLQDLHAIDVFAGEQAIYKAFCASLGSTDRCGFMQCWHQACNLLAGNFTRVCSGSYNTSA